MIDVLKQQRAIQAAITIISTTYQHLHQSDPQYQHILLQARSLKAQIFHYDRQAHIPLKEPLVYLSSVTSELPVIINTGASCSLTPCASDFTSKLERPDITTLSQVNGQADVISIGNVN